MQEAKGRDCASPRKLVCRQVFSVFAWLAPAHPLDTMEMPLPWERSLVRGSNYLFFLSTTIQMTDLHNSMFCESQWPCLPAGAALPYILPTAHLSGPC